MANEQFVIRLGLNSAGVERGVDSAIGNIQRLYSQWNRMGHGMVEIGALAAIGKFFLSQAAWAGDLQDTADKLDVTARSVQALKYAAASLKTPFEDIENGLDKTRKAQSEAIEGNEEMRLNFQRLGFTLDDLKRKDSVELFLGISKAVEEGKVSSANYAALLAVVGKEAKKLIAFMKDGAASLTEGFDKSSFVVQQNLVNALDESDKALSKMWANFKAFTRWAGANFAGGILSAGKLAGGLIAATAGTPGRETRDRLAVSRELQNDPEYAKIIEFQAKLEAKLNAKLALKGEEHSQYEILKKKNDEREKELKLAGMSESKRRQALEHEKQELELKIRDNKNELEREKLRTRLVEINGQLERNKKESPSEGGLASNSDALSSIGLYRGFAGRDVAHNYPSQQLSALNRIEQHLSRIASHADKPSPEVQKTIQGLNEMVNILRGTGTDLE